jgi:cysteine-rich repeat protein
MKKLSLLPLLLLGACSLLFRNLSAPECTETRCSDDQSFLLVCEHPNEESVGVEHGINCVEQGAIDCVPNLRDSLGQNVIACSLCGDGLVDSTLVADGVNPREQCDDGNITSGDGCDALCIDEFCGDAIDNDGANEECDSGANNSDTLPNTCRSNCTLPTCGDSVVDSNEFCDDGNPNSGDGCSSSCTVEACGDGFLNIFTEQCDTGTANSNTAPDACRLDCTVPRCGDGVKDSTDICDGADLGTNTCASADPNSPAGTLSCNSDCTLNTSQCTP